MNRPLPLPPGWVSQWSQEHGREFFVETATGRSQWEPPVAILRTDTARSDSFFAPQSPRQLDAPVNVNRADSLRSDHFVPVPPTNTSSLRNASIHSVTPTTTMSTKGVRLSYLNFLVVHWGPQRLQGQTTQNVCDAFVKPWTAPLQCSAVELLSRSRDPNESKAVGEATFFVSHAWGYKFLETVEAINCFFDTKAEEVGETREDPVIWFDLFSNSQHGTSELPFEWWETTFMQAIKKMKNVLMVCTPWDDPYTLTRSWCAYEVFATKKTDSSFHVALTRSEKLRFAKDILVNMKPYNKMLCNVSIARSSASNPKDRENIFGVIQKTFGRNGKGGIAHLDALVKGVLTEWVLKNVDEFARSANDVAQSLKYEKAKATLLFSTGKFDRSVTVYEGCLNTTRAKYGETDTQTLEVVVQLAASYEANGEVKKGINLYERYVPQLQRALGSNHIGSWLMYITWANLCSMQFEYEKSRSMILNCLPSIERQFGMNHLLRSAALSCFGMNECRQGFFQSAVEPFRTSEAILKSSHAEEQNILIATGGLAAALACSGNTEVGLPMLRDIVDRSRSVMGDANISTILLQLVYNLSLIWTGKFEEALPLSEECWHKTSAMFGPEHFLTLSSALRVAMVYQELGSFKEALDILNECARRQNRLGPFQLCLLKVYMGKVVTDFKDYDHALDLLQDAHETCVHVLKEDHRLTNDALIALLKVQP